MKIISKIFIVIFLLIILFFSNTYAVDIVLNDTQALAIQENDINEIVLNNQSNSTTINPAPTVSYSSSTTNNTLSISDIIDIILIAVCIVLIFLAIAILIRCK